MFCGVGVLAGGASSSVVAGFVWGGGSGFGVWGIRKDQVRAQGWGCKRRVWPRFRPGSARLVPRTAWPQGVQVLDCVHFGPAARNDAVCHTSLGLPQLGLACDHLPALRPPVACDPPEAAAVALGTPARLVDLLQGQTGHTTQHTADKTQSTRGGWRQSSTSVGQPAGVPSAACL